MIKVSWMLLMRMLKTQKLNHGWIAVHKQWLITLSPQVRVLEIYLATYKLFIQRKGVLLLLHQLRDLIWVQWVNNSIHFKVIPTQLVNKTSWWDLHQSWEHPFCVKLSNTYLKINLKWKMRTYYQLNKWCLCMMTKV